MISSFTGPHRFLSNFYPCRVDFKGEVYLSAEHAYQAAKSLDPDVRARVRALPTAASAKSAGRRLVLRSDWEAVKVDVMRQILREKFSNFELAAQLLATGDEVIVEGNTWGDRFWGVSRGYGENWLGRLLMEVRGETRASVSAGRRT